MAEQREADVDEFAINEVNADSNITNLRPDGMASSPFAKLSAELRNRIYELALTCDEPIPIDHSHFMINRLACVYGIEQEHLLALTQTCKTVRAESFLLFFAVNTFLLITCSMRRNRLHSLDCFERAIGAKNAAALRSVIVDAPLTDIFDMARTKTRTAVRLLSQRAVANPDCSYTFLVRVRNSTADRVSHIEIEVRDLPSTCAEVIKQLPIPDYSGYSSILYKGHLAGLFANMINKWQTLADRKDLVEPLSGDSDTGQGETGESEDEANDSSDECDLDDDDSQVNAMLEGLRSRRTVNTSAEIGHDAASTKETPNTSSAAFSIVDSIDPDEQYEADADE